MEAKVQLKSGVVVVDLSGRVDIEKAMIFKEAIKGQLTNRKIVFNMEKLSFVGSTGIQSLFQAFREIHQENFCQMKIAGMKPDFRRVWHLNPSVELEIFENIDVALSSYSL